MMNMMVFLITICMILSSFCYDTGDYSDTEAVFMNADLPSLVNQPLVMMEVFTSHAYLAGTNDAIQATFLGQFSVSGPHKINDVPLIAGERVHLNVTLDRQIGELKRVLLENHGTDGWLMTSLRCRIGDMSYTLKGNRQWVDSKQSDAERGFTNGREPNVHASELVPAAPKLMWNVVGSTQVYHPTGSFGE